MNEVETTRFKELENTIEKGLKVFYEVGEALMEIRDFKMYRLEGFESFEDYSYEKWGMTKSYASRLIQSSKVVDNVANWQQTDTLPQTESQTRELAKAPEEDQAPIWGLATSETESPTAKDTKEAVEVYESVKEEMPEAEKEVILEVAKERKQDGSFHISSKENDWYTPNKYIESARTVLDGIDLDPASSDLAQKTVKASTYYTAETNGLDKDWMGSVWMNPPYSMPEIQNFIDKLLSENISEWIVLTNNSSDTGWFHKLLDSADLVCFTKGRVGFENVEGQTMATRQGQAFFYKGKNKEKFIENFNIFGAILEVLHVYKA